MSLNSSSASSRTGLLARVSRHYPLMTCEKEKITQTTLNTNHKIGFVRKLPGTIRTVRTATNSMMQIQGLTKDMEPEKKKETSIPQDDEDTTSETSSCGENESKKEAKSEAYDEVEAGDTKASDGTIVKPTKFDVLFGRGKPYQGHSGNIRLHKVVDVYKPRYSQARRHVKTEIAEEIVQFIKGGGEKSGRFLKRTEGEDAWVEVSDTIARDKVSHALRGKSRHSELATESPEPLIPTKRIGGNLEQAAKRQRMAAHPLAAEMYAQRSQGGFMDPLSGRIFPSAVTGAALPANLFHQDAASNQLLGRLHHPLGGSLPPQLAASQLYSSMGGMRNLSGFLPMHHSPRLTREQEALAYLQSLRGAESQFLASGPRPWW